ncbi:hypothetical protein RQP46_001991 [Phenoliferia psychrophenolica]
MNELVGWTYNMISEDEIDFVDHPDEVPFEDLTACCLSSKALLGPARARLYRTAFITVRMSESYSHAQRHWTDDESSRVASKEQRLESTLIFNPHLATLVREVVITYGRRPCSAELVPTLALANVLRACPLVRTLTVWVSGPIIYHPDVIPTTSILNDAEAEALARAIATCRPALQRAELRDVVCETTVGRIWLYNALVQIPTLQHLWLPSAARRRTSGVLVERGPAELRTLGVDYIPKRDIPLFNNIFKAPVGSNLRDLAFHQSCDIREEASELPGGIRRLTKLTKLEWRFSPPTDTHPSTSDAEGSALVLKVSFYDIQHLPLTDFSLINLNRFGAGNEDLVDELDYLPSTLERLHIPLPPPDILADLLQQGKKDKPLSETSVGNH